jgi:hypothetical protein
MNSEQWIDIEPGLEDLMADPIMRLLLAGDGIDAGQVLHAVELARRRLDRPIGICNQLWR